MNWTESEIEFVEGSVCPPGEHAPPRPLPPSPRGTANGMQNYRGYPLRMLDAVTMKGVDFSRARSPKNPYGIDSLIQLSCVDCTDVCFDRAGTFHSIGGTFLNCTFKKIRTSQAGLIGSFENCDFSGANLRGAMLGANFHECCFDGANLLVGSWEASFRNCTFCDTKIDNLFADIKNYVEGGGPVTFSILTSGKIQPGVAVQR